MDESVVRVEGVSKKYCRSLKQTMLYGLNDLARTFLGLNQQTERLRNGEFWAVNDVSFDMKSGETLGIIGPNGSGKSTLLKMLNGIFMPDKGKIEIKRRVGALIEVGAGFHPMLTGRENIYINGSILGMSKREIDKKFDQIVEFADIDEFIDSPVKHYSSGMYVRLGFAIAIHSEPDVLLVDEILSVGDVAFQKKCIGKIQELKQHMAIVFVSHSVRQVYRICDRCTLLWNGVQEQMGDVKEVVNTYLRKSFAPRTSQEGRLVMEAIEEIRVLDAGIYDGRAKQSRTLESGKPLKVRLCIEAAEEFDDVICVITIMSAEGSIVTVMNTEGSAFKVLHVGRNLIECVVREMRLIPGLYSVNIKLKSKYGVQLLHADLGDFEIYDAPGILRPMLGFYREKADWSHTHYESLDSVSTQ